MAPRLNHGQLLGISALGGVVVALGFTPTWWWWLLPLGVSAFYLVALLARPRFALLCGAVFGFVFNLITFRWIDVRGVYVMVALAVFMSLWYALVALVVSALRQTKIWGFAGIAAWMGMEWLCARVPFGGFGWGRLAYTMAESPLRGLYPLVGSTGVSLLIVAFCVTGTWMVLPLVKGERKTPGRTPLLSGAVILLVSFAGGIGGQWYDPGASGGQYTVAVVQGNVPGVGIHALGPRYTVENNHLAQTIILAARIRTGQVDQPDFVVWPENSTSTDPDRDPRTARAISTSLDLVQVPILVGAITTGPKEDERQVTGQWWTADGVTAFYSKRNLVPFGEYVPLRSFFEPLVPDLVYAGVAVPGVGPGVLVVEMAGEELRVGDLICFELAYDATVDDVLKPPGRPGAQIVVVQTSNAPFTGSNQIDHQRQITLVRAMESRREILISTTNSVAGLIDNHGRPVYEAQPRTSDVQVFTVPLRTHLTPAIAYRGWFDLASVTLPLLGCLFLGIRHRRTIPGEPSTVEEVTDEP